MIIELLEDHPLTWVCTPWGYMDEAVLFSDEFPPCSCSHWGFQG